MMTSPTWHFAVQAPDGLHGEVRRSAAKCGEDLDTQRHQDDWTVLKVSVNCPVAT